ncbi:MAG: LON peptidase substrate-binding domain-containing protein, partial [Planctomycetota bacterium]
MGIFRNDDDPSQPAGSDSQPSGTVVPLLPLRDIVVFPHMVVPLFVGRAKSIRALEDAMEADRELMLCAQREAGEDEPGPKDIYTAGTLGSIIQLLRLPDGTVKVLVEGKSRAKVARFVSDEPYFSCEVEAVDEQDTDGVEVEALVRTVHSTFESYIKLNKKVPPETLNTVLAINA